jgi:phage protein D
MSRVDQARRATAQVSFNGVDVTSDIKPYLKSLSYTDSEDGEADDLQLTLQDREGIWLAKWLDGVLDAAASKGTGEVDGTLEVGSVVSFTGSRHYVSSTSDTGYKTSPGKGKITAINLKGKHPYHLIHVDSSTTLYGWVDAGDISASTTTSVKTGAGKYTVTPSVGLYVRKGPGTGNPKMGVLSKGTEVTVSEITGGWAKITYNGQTGYVYAQYLKKSGDSTQDEDTGLLIEAVIVRENWTGDGKDQVLSCGTFQLDAVDYGGPPAEVTIKGTSLSYAAAIRQTKHNKGWENYHLSAIVKEMAEKSGMACLYLSDIDPYYERVEQYQESDISFLSTLCAQAGNSLKATGQMLVVYDQAAFEGKDPVHTILRGVQGGYLSYQLSAGKADTQYQSCRVSYNDPATGKSIQGIAKVEDWEEDEDNQQLEITAKVGSIAEAETLAAKYLRAHNKYCRTAEFTLPGDTAFSAGATVALEGWGSWDGKYIISSTTHTVGEDGYKTGVTLRRALEGY